MVKPVTTLSTPISLFAVKIKNKFKGILFIISRNYFLIELRIYKNIMACQICSLSDDVPELNCKICFLYFHVKCSGIKINPALTYSETMLFICPQCHDKLPQYVSSSSPPSEVRLSQITNQLSDALMKFDSSLENMKLQYDCKIEGLRYEFNDKIDVITEELKEMKVLAGKFSAEKIEDSVIKPLINNYTKETDCEISKLHQQVENLDRLSRLKFVIIRGIPTWKNENLRDMIELGLCPAINFKYYNYDIINLWRQRSAQARGNGAPIIVVEFISKEVRDIFLKCYFNTNNLSLDKIGFESTARFYVNEYLTKNSKILLDSASELKKDGIIFQAFSRNGTIFVRKFKNSAPILITSLKQVADLKVNGIAGGTSANTQPNILQTSLKPAAENGTTGMTSIGSQPNILHTSVEE